MVKGVPPRINPDPKEERMITWRLPGDLHARVNLLCKSLNVSVNRFLTQVITEKMNSIDKDKSSK